MCCIQKDALRCRFKKKKERKIMAKNQNNVIERAKEKTNGAKAKELNDKSAARIEEKERKGQVSLR